MFDTDKFLLVGNNLSLDFVNTMIADAGKPKDLLEGLSDVMSWAIAVRLIGKGDAARYLAIWNKRARDFLGEAVRFRAILHSLFTGILDDEAVKGATLRSLNEMLDDQTGFTELVRNETGFEKRFHSDFREPRQILASVAASAADLLCYGNLELIKRCEAEGCVLYFYDTTKNHSRRWCSMAGCGNRAKASAFYRRKKLSSA